MFEMQTCPKEFTGERMARKPDNTFACHGHSNTSSPFSLTGRSQAKATLVMAPAVLQESIPVSLSLRGFEQDFFSACLFENTPPVMKTNPFIGGLTRDAQKMSYMGQSIKPTRETKGALVHPAALRRFWRMGFHLLHTASYGTYGWVCLLSSNAYT